MKGSIWTIIHLTVLLVSSFESPVSSEVEFHDTNRTTTAPVTTTTPVSTTTTTVPTTTTTPVPTTTTTTTTPKTTTTTTTTTTPAPKTTSVPTTTDSPTTPEPTKEGTWNVTDGNLTCIMVEMKAELILTYLNETTTVPIPPEAVVSHRRSSCHLSNETQVIVLKFLQSSLEIEFERNSDSVYVKNITLLTILEDFPLVYNNDSKFFPVKFGNSYMCRSTETILLNSVEMKKSPIMLQIESIHMQSFRSKLEDGFGMAEECPADEKISDVVPIAVACALAILIVIVLIAYLVGRRRNRQKGYTSV